MRRRRGRLRGPRRARRRGERGDVAASRIRRLAAVAAAGVVAGGAAAPLALDAAGERAAGARAERLPGAPRCPVFPADNPWNRRVDRLPVWERSERIVASIGAERPLHPDFGAGRHAGAPIGIPYTVVGARQRRVPVSFGYADESDRGRYPIPRDAPIEGGRRSTGDRHVIVVDRSRCRLYELFDARPVRGGRAWRAGSGAIFDLRSNRLRPAGWTSADAAGLPILPGLARYDEVARGEIRHALRFTAPRTRRAYVYPARHFASRSDDPDLPPMGLRLRLRRDFDVSGFPRQARVVLVALKRYGMMLADNGSPWYVTGVPDARWDDDQLRALRQVRGSDFEVVDPAAIRPPRRR